MAALEKRKKIIVYCGLGGTIEVGIKPWAPGRTKSFKDDPERMFGRESRSLKGCYELQEVNLASTLKVPATRVESVISCIVSEKHGLLRTYPTLPAKCLASCSWHAQPIFC